MGLIGKFSEMRMKDAAEGTLRVVGITMPDPTATSCNYRMDGVVSADGLLPTAVTHHGMCSTRRWPSPGDELPVTVDRAKPEHLVVHWKELPTGQETAQSMAQQLAAQMRSGGTTSGMAGAGMPAAGMPGLGLDALLQSAMAGVSAAGLGAGAVPPGGIPSVSNAEVLASGTPGNATVLGTFPPPVPVVKEGRTGVGLMLNVMIDGRPPYQAQNIYAVPNDKVGKLTMGALLPVKVNPQVASIVAIDWDAIH
jgi:hypothetical protein